MFNIDKIYIDDAIRIRKEYLNALNIILEEEKSINEKKSEIINIHNHSNEIINSELSDVTKRLKLNLQLNEIEKRINEIQDKIRPYYEKIENLRLQADRLYSSIIEKYPNISTEEIQQQIYPHIQILETK